MLIEHIPGEVIYHDECDMIDNVMNALQAADMNATKTDSASGKVTGRLKKDVFLKTLRQCFPLKTNVRFNQIKRALSKEDAAEGKVVHYVNLFREDVNGDQGPFAEAVRDQHVEEREEYLEDLDEAFRARGVGESEGASITVESIKKVPTGCCSHSQFCIMYVCCSLCGSSPWPKLNTWPYP